MEKLIMVEVFYADKRTAKLIESNEWVYGIWSKGGVPYYLERTLASIPKNDYVGFKSYEVDSDYNIIDHIETQGKTW